MRRLFFLLALLILLLNQAIAASRQDKSFAKLNAQTAADRYFTTALKGDDLEVFWSRWSTNEKDFFGDELLLKFRSKCACSGDRKNYGPRFQYESSLIIATSAVVVSSTELPLPTNGLILMDDVKATRQADVEVEFEVVGDSIGKGQYEWVFRLYPKKVERKTFKFVFIPHQPDPKGRVPLPGWYLLYKFTDPMHISPQAVLEYYERQLVFLQNRAKLGHDDEAHRAAKVLAMKNQEQLASYLRGK
jgi:hypothetical protein